MAKRKMLEIPMWLVIALGIGLFGSIYFFTKPRNSSNNIDQYVNEYIENSIDIELFDINKVENIEFNDIYVGLSLKKLHRSKLSSIPNNYFTVFNSSHNKYFRVLLISSTESLKIHRTYIKNTLVKAKVNQKQFKDPNYGTRENPIPVLYLEIPKYERSQGYHMIKKKKEEYKEAVYYYLAYLMPKDEFKEMFIKNR